MNDIKEKRAERPGEITFSLGGRFSRTEKYGPIAEKGAQVMDYSVLYGRLDAAIAAVGVAYRGLAVAPPGEALDAAIGSVRAGAGRREGGAG